MKRAGCDLPVSSRSAAGLLLGPGFLSGRSFSAGFSRRFPPRTCGCFFAGGLRRAALLSRSLLARPLFAGLRSAGTLAVAVRAACLGRLAADDLIEVTSVS